MMEEMKANIQKFPAYKYSGVDWLGEVPEHWEVKKLKFIGNIYPGLNGKKGDDFSKEFSVGLKAYIPFTNICNNVQISEEHFHYVKVDEREKQNRVLKNDILFLMSSETLEDIALCSIYLGDNTELYLNSFCKGFRISNPRINPEYINYLFLSSTYRSYFSLVGRGFTRVNLKQEYINDAFSLLPPLPEQTAIAAFLDRKAALIDKAIAIKEKQIELLKERRQIIIHQAVTRGLDPTVKMKDSGVEWIGEVPEGWEVLPGLRFFKENKRSNIGMKETVVLSLSYGNVIVKPIEKLVGLVPESFETYQIVKPYDIIIRGTDLQNDKTSLRTGLAKNDGIITSAYLNLCTNEGQNPEYIHYYLHALDITKILYKFGSGLRQNLSFLDFKRLPVLSIPSNEQISIVRFLKVMETKTATAIALKHQEIEKLKEYKATLINSAVTGKIKVC